MIPNKIWDSLTFYDRVVMNMIPVCAFEIMAPLYLWWRGDDLNLSLLWFIVALGCASAALAVYHLGTRFSEINRDLIARG